MEECIRFLRNGFEDGTYVYWIAQHQGEIVSTAFVQRIRKVPKPDRIADYIGYLTNVFTLSGHRNRGVGTELLETMVAWARREDLDALIVWPSDRSISLYERCGFRSRNDVMEFDLRDEAGV